MSFHIAASASSLVALLLGLGWLFAGRLLLKRWRIEATEPGLLVGRRIGAVYIGLSLMFFLARSAPPSEVRSALAAGAFLGLALLAGLGVFELKAQRAGPGILVSVAIEVVLATGFASVLLTGIG